MMAHSTSFFLFGVLIIYYIIACSGQVLRPDCTGFTPAPCDVIPDISPSGQYIYVSYIENCTSHTCTMVSPTSTSYTWLHPNGTTLTINPWFCNASIVNYQARIEANTGLPPGKKEDYWAECNYKRLKDLLQLGNCQDRKTWTCDDCAEAYKYWVCAVSFLKCETFVSLYSTNTMKTTKHDLYGTSYHQNKSITYSKILPCRGVCFDVYRKCPYAIGFQCPGTDTRDYSDWPECNDVGNPNAPYG